MRKLIHLYHMQSSCMSCPLAIGNSIPSYPLIQIVSCHKDLPNLIPLHFNPSTQLAVPMLKNVMFLHRWEDFS